MHTFFHKFKTLSFRHFLKTFSKQLAALHVACCNLNQEFWNKKWPQQIWYECFPCVFICITKNFHKWENKSAAYLSKIRVSTSGPSSEVLIKHSQNEMNRNLGEFSVPTTFPLEPEHLTPKLFIWTRLILKNKSILGGQHIILIRHSRTCVWSCLPICVHVCWMFMIKYRWRIDVLNV